MTGNEGHETADTRHRDTAIDRAWREASDEQPPPRVDAAILAAAREALSDTDARVTAIAARRRPGGRWTRWQPLLAAASVAGLAFVLLQTLPRDREAAPPPGVAAQASATATVGQERGGANVAAQSRPVTADEATASSPAAAIVALHASGDLAAAAEALRAFRAEDPRADDRLPESLRDWARTVE